MSTTSLTRRRWLVLLGLAVSLSLAGAGCSRPGSKSQDPHVERGYALLLKDPGLALKEFEQAKETKDGNKEYSLGLAHEALGHLELAKRSFDAALAKRDGLIPAETARARIALLQGDAAGAHDRLRGTVVKAPGDLTAVLLFALSAKSEPGKIASIAALKAWPNKRRSATKDASPPAEYFATLAWLQDATGNSAEARASYSRCLAADVHSSAGAVALARLAAGVGDPALARLLLERLAKSSLPEREVRDALALALGMESLPLARGLVERLPALPDDPRSLVLAAQVQLRSQQEARAVSTLNRALTKLPVTASAQRAEAQFLLGQAYVRLELADRALPLLEAIERSEPARPAVQLLLARVALLQKQPQAAVSRLRRLEPSHKKLPDLYQLLGAAELAAGHLGEAEKALRQAVQLEPESPAALMRLVDVLKRQDKPSDVGVEYRRAVDRNPKNAAFLRHYVTYLLESGQSGQALVLLKEKADTAPDDAELGLLLASVYERFGRKAELRATLEQLTRQVPKNSAVWLSLARLAETEGRLDAVRAALQSALEADPHSKDARRHLAELCVRQGVWAEAAEHYEKLLADAPTDTAALNNLAAIEADRLAAPDRAVELAERAASLAENNPAVLDTLGWALVRRGKPEDLPRAVDLLRRATTLLEHPDCRLHLAVALHLSGKAKEAAALMVGFAFRKDDPGHQYAKAMVSAGR